MTKTRLANKTIWALEDMIAGCREMRRALVQAERRAKGQMDAVMLGSLLTISRELAHIERMARDARQGKYRENG